MLTCTVDEFRESAFAECRSKVLMSDNPPSAIDVHRGSVSNNGSTTSLRFELRKGKDFKVRPLQLSGKLVTNI